MLRGYLAGAAIGAVIGTMLGISLQNPLLGVGLGLCFAGSIGTVLALVLSRGAKAKSDDQDAARGRTS